LLPNLFQNGRIVNFLFFIIQIARTSRCETHSGLVSPLKEAGGRTHEEREKGNSPPTVCADRHEYPQNAEGDHKCNYTASKAFASFLWAYVGNAGIINGNLIQI
jgi:hypothetical protein